MLKDDRGFGRFRGWIPSPLLPRRADLPSGAFSLVPLRPDVSQRRAGRLQFRARPCLYTRHGHFLLQAQPSLYNSVIIPAENVSWEGRSSP